MIKSLGEIDSWYGHFPGEHEYSTLADLERDPTSNPELELLFGAAQRIIDEWRGNKFAGLYLYGTPGTGKTHAAIGLGRTLAENGAEVHYAYGENVINRVNLQDWDTGRSQSWHNDDIDKIFPRSFSNDLCRNPRTVLLFDEYKPPHQRALMAATEAAAQFGGLVIVTSNHTDPFQLVEQPLASTTTEEATAKSILKEIDPETAESLVANQQAEAVAVSESFRSRVATGFKFIRLTGTDRRIEEGFWV